MSSHFKPVLGSFLLALVAGFAALIFFSGARASTQQQAASSQDAPIIHSVIRLVRNPDPAPDFTLADLDGKPLALAGSRGKVTLLNFWATWCGPCRAEISDLVDLQARYKEQLQIIGLLVDVDSPEEAKRLVRDASINYRVAIASADLRTSYGGIPALPTSFLLDPQGRVVQKHVGLRDPGLYETEIRALLGLPVEARVETFEDNGEIFLKNASRATEIPGVDFSKLTAEQKKIALRRFNSESCTCGCTLTLAQCRINDTACAVSLSLTGKIVAQIAGHSEPAKPSPAAAKP